MEISPVAAQPYVQQNWWTIGPHALLRHGGRLSSIKPIRFLEVAFALSAYLKRLGGGEGFSRGSLKGFRNDPCPEIALAKLQNTQPRITRICVPTLPLTYRAKHPVFS